MSTLTERLLRVLASPYLTAQPTKVSVPEEKGMQEAAGMPPANAPGMAGFPMGMDHASMPAMPSSVPGAWQHASCSQDVQAWCCTCPV